MSKTEPSIQHERAYQVLARKYRPSNFDELIGQEAMVQTLANAFRLNRIAQGFMLTGVRGVGKTTTARILARALNYEAEGGGGPTIDMPDLGAHCGAIMESRHVDVLEMDAASHTGVEDIREIIESTRYKPISARYKVYIVDEVHMLSKSAFNALLKTLEEPPEHVKFIFATTEVQKVPVTVLSRCQRFDLKRIDMAALIRHFARIAEKEGATVDEEALALIAQAAQGSVRDGLSILDQAIAHADDKVSGEDVRAMLGLADRMRIFDLLEQMLKGDAATALASCEALFLDGAEPVNLLRDLAETVHILTRRQIAQDSGGEALSQTERARATDMAAQLSVGVLSRAWQMLIKGLDEVMRAPDQLAALEMILIRIAYAADLPSPEELARAVSGASAPPQGKQAATGGASPAMASPQARANGHGDSLAQPDMQSAASGGGALLRAAPMVEAFSSGPADFVQLAELIGRDGGLMLKIAFEENVRPVSFVPGAIEIALVEGAPRGLANDVKRLLHEASGENWVVAVSDAPGGETLKEMRERTRRDELEIVSKHPLVKAALKQFPGAQITDVRPITPEEKE